MLTNISGIDSTSTVPHLDKARLLVVMYPELTLS